MTGCTCGPNGTLSECAAELAAGGWCPRAQEVRARVTAAQAPDIETVPRDPGTQLPVASRP